MIGFGLTLTYLYQIKLQKNPAEMIELYTI